MNRKILIVVCIICTLVFFSCKNCEKLLLTSQEKEWVDLILPNQQYFFINSSSGKVDTLEILTVSSDFTPCNKFELSEYQHETYVIRSVFRSKNKYNGGTCLLTLIKDKKTAIDPEIVVAGLGTLQNSTRRSSIVFKDSSIGGIEYKQLAFFQEGINAEQYNQQKSLKSFCWDKQQGLVSYTTSEGEVFFRQK